MSSHYLLSAAFIFGTLINFGFSQRLPTPVRIKVPMRTMTHVRVTWKQPTAVTYERFLVKISPRATVLPPETPGETSRTFTDLEPGMAYTVTLRGETAEGRRSPPLRFHIWSKPRMPRNIVLEPIRQIKLAVQLAEYEDSYSAPVVGVHVNWDKPDGPTGLRGYDVKIDPKEDCAMLYPQPAKGEEPDETSRIFAGLTPGQRYKVTVRTKTGPPFDLVYSDSISSSTVIPPATPFSVEVTDTGTSYATVSALGPIVGIHDGLKLELEPDQGRIGTPTLDPIYSRFLDYTITGLKPNTTYKLKVYSVSNGVKSYEPFIVTIKTKPAAPMLLQVTAFDEQSVTLRWDQPHVVASDEPVTYVIRYVDMADLELGRNDTITVDSGALFVNAKIQKLVPGVTYRFIVYSKSPESEPVRMADAVQTTTPPLPVVASLDKSNGGVLLVFGKPPIGRCALVKVHVSPGQTNSEPAYYRVGEEIYLAGVPRDERYTIHSRCVVNNLEGPELAISSRANFDPETGKIRDLSNLPRKTLPCIVPRLAPRALPRPEKVAPNSCCGSRPYHSSTYSCCGNKLIQSHRNQLCCGVATYTKPDSICCNNGIVRPVAEGCDAQ